MNKRFDFLFTYTHEADTGTTIFIESRQSGVTLNNAWDHVASSLGGGWWRLATRHIEEWHMAVRGPDDLWHPVVECDDCAGDGCAACDHRGYQADAANDATEQPHAGGGDGDGA